MLSDCTLLWPAFSAVPFVVSPVGMVNRCGLISLEFGTHIENFLLYHLCSLCSIQISIFLELFKKNLFFYHLHTYFKGPLLAQKLFDWPDFFSTGSGIPIKFF